jgi:hypothetical protein
MQVLIQEDVYKIVLLAVGLEAFLLFALQGLSLNGIGH